MTYELRIGSVQRWTHRNEYEGAVDGELDGVPVTVYVLAGPDGWAEFTPGATVTVDAWVEPAGEITVVAPGTPPALVQRDGVNYTITGTLTGQEEDSLFLATVPPLRIDLDTATRAKLPSLHRGDTLSLRGVIEVDLPDEW